MASQPQHVGSADADNSMPRAVSWWEFKHKLDTDKPMCILLGGNCWLAAVVPVVLGQDAITPMHLDVAALVP